MNINFENLVKTLPTRESRLFDAKAFMGQELDRRRFLNSRSVLIREASKVRIG